MLLLPTVWWIEQILINFLPFGHRSAVENSCGGGEHLDGQHHLVGVADAHHPSGRAARPAGDVSRLGEGLQHVLILDLGAVHVPDDDIPGLDHGVDVHPDGGGPVPAEN